ncbi:hypothetical protein CJ260_00970 [Megasphaera sp. ASD88]|uniref:hypothetical protein n=1 Tax=Megasphaera sp. ASD88 TaxID=2027407 RepID=UPI000BAB6EFC|nr:hypothetical protein [Megasphaera sp. ASD88]PAV40040.1 hypothetical protein CJ260_00970 [Megasphaera sp. ASD88]
MMLNYSVTEVLNLLMIIGVLATWFHYVALRPIKQLLFALKDEIKELSVEIKNSREDRRHFAEKLSGLEESLKAAHARIKELRQELLTLRREVEDGKK